MGRLFRYIPLIFKRPYHVKILDIFGSSVIAFFSQWELTGSTCLDISGNGRNGAYSNVALGQPGSWSGRTAVGYNGTTSVANIFTAGLQGAFNGLEGGILAQAKTSVWNDAINRVVVRLRADANNRVGIERSTSNNMLSFLYLVGGVNDSITVSGLGSAAWYDLAMAWSKSGDYMKGYVNGAIVSGTRSSLGSFVGSLSSTFCAIGSQGSTPTLVWSGLIQNVVILNRPPTTDEVKQAFSR